MGTDSSKSVQSDQGKLVPVKSKRVKSWFRKPLKFKLHEVEELAEEGDPTDVLEVWFVGCHSGTRGTTLLRPYVKAYSCEDLRCWRGGSA